MNTYDNLLRFNNILKKIGVWDALIKYEIKRGDTVEIYGFEFEWEDDE
nr:Obg family GTPase CgtA [Mycoplasmopsis cynos]